MTKKESNQPRIKIYLSYHADAARLRNEVMTPIHVGRASANSNVKEKLQDIVGDNTGSHISEKNKNYCELTAQYWAWKNFDDAGNPDYIGFMHYRRHLNFNNPDSYHPNKWGLINHHFLDQEYIKKFGLDEKSIQARIGDADIVTVEPWDVRNAGSRDNYDHYKSSDSKIFIKDYDEALRILLDKYPEYKESADTYNKSYMGYYTNIFVMRKSLFLEYCDWLFSILFELEKRLDISGYNREEARVFGYISEWLFGIYITHKKLQGKEKIIELQRTFVEDTSPQLEIPIVFSSDDNYAQHMGVTINSILKNKSNEKIKIYIIDGGISEKNKQGIRNLIGDRKDVACTYLTTDRSQFSTFTHTGSSHISVAAFYRYLIPELTREDKIIYLDCDIVVKSSLRELYLIDIEDYFFGGVIDVLVEENTKRLHLKKYCNSGVLLLNSKKLRNEGMPKKLMQYTREHHDKIVWGDQDVLNVVLQRGIKYLDKKWNAQSCEYPPSYEKGFNDLAKKASIIHFIGNQKPWDYENNSPMRKEYFKYLKGTPWQEFQKKYQWNRFKLKFLFNKKKDGPYKRITFLGMKFKFRSKRLEDKVQEQQYRDILHLINRVGEKVEQQNSLYNLDCEYFTPNLEFENTVLVTGGAGYIGSHCVLALLEAGRDIIIFDSLELGHQETVDTLKTISGTTKGKLKGFVKGNLLNEEDINKTLEDNIDITAVIHFAAYSQVGESVRNPGKYYRNNVVGTLNLLDAMRNHGIDRIVFSSTAATYGEPQYTPIDEKHPQNPVNPYGMSKLTVEHIMDDYDRAYGLRSVRLRYFNAAGADTKARIGEWHEPETHLIPNILKAAKPKNAGGEQKTFRLFGTDYDTRDGTCVRDYIHVEDLANAHVKALEYLEQGNPTTAFNLGTNDGSTVKEVFAVCEQVTEQKIPVTEEPRRPGDPAVLIADNTKAKTTLNWSPEKTLTDSVSSVWGWENTLAVKKD